MSNTITRRAALTGTAAGAAAIVAGTGPVIATTDHLDAALFALEPVFNEANQRWRAAMDVRAEAEARYVAALPPMPDDRQMPADIRRWMDDLPIRAFGKLPESHPISEWFSEADADMQEWRAERDRLHDETGLTAAEDAEYECMCDVDDVLRQIMAIRAMTVEGLRLKVRVTEVAGWADCIGTGEEELLPSLIADIEAMAGGQEARS